MILAVYEARVDAKTVVSWYASRLEGWVKAVEEGGGRINPDIREGGRDPTVNVDSGGGGVIVEAVY